MRELRVAGGGLEAVLLPEVGARLHRLRAFGHDLLHSPDDRRQQRTAPFAWGAYVMAPWCNRLSTAPLVVAGRTVELPANFPDGTAIHGQVYVRPWMVDRDGTTCRIRGGGNGWPWPYEATFGVRPSEAGLRLELSVVNVSDGPMPAGIGLHPWWRRPLLVAVDAGRVYASNTRPAAQPQPVAGAYDLRSLAAPANGLDATWTSLGGRPVQLAWPDLDVLLELRLNGADHVVMATPDGGEATALEVQTHAPDGLGRLLRDEAGAMALVRRGEALRMALELSVSQLSADGGVAARL